MSKLPFAVLLMFLMPSILTAQGIVLNGRVAARRGRSPLTVDPDAILTAQKKAPVAMSDTAHPPELSGTVVDTSGAVISGANVEVRSANGTVPATAQSDANGSFTLSGLSSGNYRLVVSNPGFESKEVPVTVGATETPAPLRISLAVSSVNTP